MLSLRFAFMMVATPAACAIALWRPIWGLLCLVFMYYFRPDIYLAPQWFRPVFFITVAVAVGWATRVRTFSWHTLLTMSVLVLLGHLVSSLVAVEDVNLALDCTLTIGKLMVVQFLVVQLVDTPRKLNMFLWANVIGMLWNIKTVIYLGLTGDAVTEDLRVDVGVGQGGGANYLAMVLVMLLPIALINFQVGTPRERRFSFLIMPLILMAVVFTGSRSGFIGVGVVVLHQILRSQRKVLALVSAVILGTVGYVFTPEEHWERFEQGVAPEEGQRRDFAAESRLRLWKASFEMIKESPVLGIGPDNFGLVSPRYAGFYAGRDAAAYVPGLRKAGMVAHNTWIQTLAEGGILSGIPFVAMFVMTFVMLFRLRRRVPKDWPEYRTFHSLSVMLEGIFIGFVVCANFGSYIKVDFMWWYFGAVSALCLMVEERLTAARDRARRDIIAARLGTGGTRPSLAGARV